MKWTIGNQYHIGYVPTKEIHPTDFPNRVYLPWVYYFLTRRRN